MRKDTVGISYRVAIRIHDLARFAAADLVAIRREYARARFVTQLSIRDEFGAAGLRFRTFCDDRNADWHECTALPPGSGAYSAPDARGRRGEPVL